MNSWRYDETPLWLLPRSMAAWRQSDGQPAAHPDRAAKAIATNSVWVAEFGSKVVGWVEVGGATIESLYVSPAAARLGVGSSLLIHAEREIRDAGASIAYLDASPNAEAFYARRGYRRVGEVKANNSVPMSKRLEPQSRLTSRLNGPA
jgi:ribosomal protein S18 acetylase RimI-like enzyme